MRQVLFIILLIIGGLNVKLRADALPEYTIKAAYLYYFILLTDWPDEEKKADIPICFYGENSFGSTLDALKKKNIGEHTLTIRSINTIAEAKECKMLFFGQGELSKEEKIIESMSRSSVLIVTDNPKIRDPHIKIIKKDQKLAFDISLKKLKEAKLTVSSKLLKLARKVVQ